MIFSKWNLISPQRIKNITHVHGLYKQCPNVRATLGIRPSYLKKSTKPCTNIPPYGGGGGLTSENWRQRQYKWYGLAIALIYHSGMTYQPAGSEDFEPSIFQSARKQPLRISNVKSTIFQDRKLPFCCFRSKKDRM